MYAAIDVMFIINPPPFFLIIGKTCFIISRGPKKFVLNKLSTSDKLDSSIGPVNPIPALLINISILPSF